MDRTTRPVAWRLTGDARLPLVASVAGETWHIRIGEFPEAESTFVLVVDGREEAHLSEWPAAWTRPAEVERPARGDWSEARGPSDEYERGVFDAEIAHFERTHRVRPSSLVRPPGDAVPKHDAHPD
jgi:hypothetical protein